MSYQDYEGSNQNGSPLELYRFTAGANVWALTSGPKEVVLNDVTYEPAAVARNDVELDAGDPPKNMEITLPQDATVVAQFIPYLPVIPVYVTVFRRHRDDPDGEYIISFFGVIASVGFSDSRAVMACRPLNDVLNRLVPWQTFQATCNWALFSLGCGLDRESYRTEALVTAVAATSTISSTLYRNVIESEAFDALADGWFDQGYVVRSSGEIRFISKHIGNALVLKFPFSDLQAGETVRAYPGCDRLRATCVGKFDNLPRFLGFDRIPTKNPFAENVYGTQSS